MLDPIEGAAVAAQFGVADEQVRRDHLISHLLVVLARDFGDRVVFFGGTALARTYLPDYRLAWDPPLTAVAGAVPGVLHADDGLAVEDTIRAGLTPAPHPWAAR